MIDLINSIDTCIAQCGKIKAYGLARLIEDDSDIYPSTYKQDGSQGEKITPNDKYTIATYHRLLEGDISDNDTYSFGRKASRFIGQRVRLVIIMDIKMGSSVIDEIIENLPDEIKHEDYRLAEINNAIALSQDARAIWTAEWGDAYKDKFQMRYRLYAIEYTLNYIACEC